ncbi:MAG: alpha/beta hydrolase [Roseovarius sp.]|nr:alpha/beta hydrolase [Roseovarius sp.]
MTDLDAAYANVPNIPGGAQYPARWAVAAEAFRAHARAELGLSYGDSPRQALDLFRPEGTARGLCVFVHGGFWLRFDRSLWSHLAAGPLARGWAVAMPSYDLCPEVRIADITRQIAQAVTVAGARVAGPIALAGHSAGGHLVARMAVPGVLPWEVATRLSHILPISPVADLRPMLRTSMNEKFGLDMAAARAESPVLMRPLAVPVTVWVGGAELPAFLDQARWLSQAWGVPLEIAEGRHHFDVIEALADPASAMVARITA